MVVCVPVVAFVIHHLCAISSTRSAGIINLLLPVQEFIAPCACICMSVCVLQELRVGVRNKHAQLAQL